jgi:hypothetical protein
VASLKAKVRSTNDRTATQVASEKDDEDEQHEPEQLSVA